MSDGAISQDEIDALLSGVSSDSLNPSGQLGSVPDIHVDTSVLQKFANDLKDSLADNVNKMTNAQFQAGNPTVETLDRDRLLAKVPDTVVDVAADFNKGLTGEHVYVMAPDFAQKIVALMNNEDNAEIDEMALSVVSEVVSTHTNDEVMALEKTGKLKGVECATPVAKNDPKAMMAVPPNKFLLFSFPLTLDGKEYTLWEAIGGDPAEKISDALGGASSKPAAAAAPAQAAAPAMGASMGMPQMGGMAGGMGQMGGMPQMGMQQMGMPQMGMGMPQMGMGQMPINVPNVQSLQYPNLGGVPTGAGQSNIGLIMDVFMEMTVELGRTKKQIKDILGMGEGTIIELDKLAGEPVDILVNHKPIAKGEVVVIDENFGVRVTQILSTLDRVAELQ